MTLRGLTAQTEPALTISCHRTFVTGQGSAGFVRFERAPVARSRHTEGVIAMSTLLLMTRRPMMICWKNQQRRRSGNDVRIALGSQSVQMAVFQYCKSNFVPKLTNLGKLTTFQLSVWNKLLLWVVEKSKASVDVLVTLTLTSDESPKAMLCNQTEI